MMLIAGVVLVSVAFVTAKMLMLGHANSATLGWMSAQWLAEHRASYTA